MTPSITNRSPPQHMVGPEAAGTGPGDVSSSDRSDGSSNDTAGEKEASDPRKVLLLRDDGKYGIPCVATTV
jgi:hypothetical protein